MVRSISPPHHCTTYFLLHQLQFAGVQCAKPILILIEIAQHFGSHSTPRGVQEHIRRHVTPSAKALSEALKRGEDPKNVILVDGVWDGKPGKGLLQHLRFFDYSPRFH